jgi:hypothetical protein
MFDMSENGKEAVISYLKKNFEDKPNSESASKFFKNELDRPIKKSNSPACLNRDIKLHTAYPIEKFHVYLNHLLKLL